jgi:hypothetical protein
MLRTHRFESAAITPAEARCLASNIRSIALFDSKDVYNEDKRDALGVIRRIVTPTRLMHVPQQHYEKVLARSYSDQQWHHMLRYPPINPRIWLMRYGMDVSAPSDGHDLSSVVDASLPALCLQVKNGVSHVRRGEVVEYHCAVRGSIGLAGPRIMQGSIAVMVTVYEEK